MWKLLILSLFTTSLGSIEDCSKGTSILKLTALDLIPAMPVINEPVVMTVQFNNPGADITTGKVTTAINYNFLPLSPTVEDICANTQCPIVSGFNDRSTNSTWPDVKGTIISTITWNTLDGSVLLCIKVSVKTARDNLRGKTNSSGIILFKDNGIGYCPIVSFLGKEISIYRKWPIYKSKKAVDMINKTSVLKLNAQNSSRTPEDL